MSKRSIIFLVLISVFACSSFSLAFYIMTLDIKDDFLDNANAVMEFMETTGIKSDPLLVCTGGLGNSTTLNIFSQAQLDSPVRTILDELNTKCVAPPRDELEGELIKDLKGHIPVIVSDSVQGGFDSFIKIPFAGIDVGIFNITQIPSDWYENVKTKVDLYALDSIIIIMDNPELKIVPQEIRSKTFVIPRNTAVYRVDIEFGPLLTEVNLSRPANLYPVFEETKEQYAKWLNKEYVVDPQQMTQLQEIPFYSQIGLMAKKDAAADLMFYYNPPLPATMTTQEAITIFKDYTLGIVHLENSNVRKLLLRSGALISYDGFETKVSEEGNYYSLYGVKYFIDLSKVSQDRLIIKTFTKPQKILVFGPKEIVKENFPFMKELDLSPLYYVFWALNAGNPPLEPSWKVTAQPYLYTYTIQKGDTINSIAAKLGITPESIKAFNPDLIDMYLTVGEHIYVHIPYDFEKRSDQ
ncbi:MAG: LysM domain-containing protein [Thermotogota bacterium]|nr:LysM domain-containing protein [Thermotogota bacterium]